MPSHHIPMRKPYSYMQGNISVSVPQPQPKPFGGQGPTAAKPGHLHKSPAINLRVEAIPHPTTLERHPPITGAWPLKQQYGHTHIAFQRRQITARNEQLRAARIQGLLTHNSLSIIVGNIIR
jgi:hypothetical protein